MLTIYFDLDLQFFYRKNTSIETSTIAADSSIVLICVNQNEANECLQEKNMTAQEYEELLEGVESEEETSGNEGLTFKHMLTISTACPEGFYKDRRKACRRK